MFFTLSDSSKTLSSASGRVLVVRSRRAAASHARSASLKAAISDGVSAAVMSICDERAGSVAGVQSSCACGKTCGLGCADVVRCHWRMGVHGFDHAKLRNVPVKSSS